jgi:hypothetical protein
VRHVVDQLWSVAGTLPHVDANAPAEAVAAAAQDPSSLDYRTRLLIRDSLEALDNHWGKTRLEQWLSQSCDRLRIPGVRPEVSGR